MSSHLVPLRQQLVSGCEKKRREGASKRTVKSNESSAVADEPKAPVATALRFGRPPAVLRLSKTGVGLERGAGMKLRRLIFGASLVLAMAALSPAAAQGATRSSVATGRAVPLLGAFRGVETVQSFSPPPPEPPLFLHSRGEWTGVATQLGRFTAINQVTVNLGDRSGIATLVFTAGNGDTVTADETGQAFPFGNAGSLIIVEHATITGGTGRFAGATGTFTIKRLATPTSPGVSSILGFFSGTISIGGDMD
jgi:hypothetical protein